MDPLETKIRELYQEKRREVEQSTPHFETFLNKVEQRMAPKHPLRLLRIAAAVALAALALTFYFYRPNPFRTDIKEISQIELNQPLPSQALMEKTFGAQYLWGWKSPTDKLLESANSKYIYNAHKTP